MVFHSYDAINKEGFSLSQAWARSWKETQKPCWSVGQWGCCKTNSKTSKAVWVFQQKIYMRRWCRTSFSAPNAQEEFSATFQESLKTFWHRQGQERSAPPTPQSSWKTPNCLHFKLCELGQMLMRLWHCGSPMLSTEDSSSPSNSHLTLWDICLLQLTDKQPGAG